jgi:hypothetical protein
MTVTPSRQHGLAALVRATKAFIDDDPTTVVVMPARGAKIVKPGGGYDWADAVPRDPQTVKLIARTGDGDGKVRNDTTYSEEIQRFSYIMVTMPDATFARGDYWWDGQTKYTVEALAAENDYERKFIVEGIGPDPNYG